MRATDAQVAEQVRLQIEYYFSVDNLVKDVFLRSKMDDYGWIATSVRLMRVFRTRQQAGLEAEFVNRVVESLDPRIRVLTATPGQGGTVQVRVCGADAVAVLQVIASFNRVRNLTQDWTIIVEALAKSLVVEVGAGGSLLRAREGWAAWVLPPDQRDRTAHAPSSTSSLAGSAAQTPLQSPQRLRAAAARPGAVHASETGPGISAAPAVVQRTEPDSRPGARTAAPAVPPKGGQFAAAAPSTAGSDTSSASVATESPSQGNAAVASTAAETAHGSLNAVAEPSVQSAQLVEASPADVKRSHDEPEAAPAPDSAASATADGSAEQASRSAAPEPSDASGHSTNAQQAASALQAAPEPPAGTSAEQTADAAAVPAPDSGAGKGTAADASTSASATLSSTEASADALKAAAGACPVQRSSEEQEDDMFQLDEVRNRVQKRRARCST